MATAEIFTFAGNRLISWLGGLGLAGGFITLNVLNSSIYLGSFSALPVSILVSAILIIGIAPIFEELFFNGLLMKIKKTELNFIWCSLITAGLFALIHSSAYGLSFSAYTSVGSLVYGFRSIGGLFFGAGLFRLGANYLNEKSKSIWGSLLAHIIINFYLFFATSRLFLI